MTKTTKYRIFVAVELEIDETYASIREAVIDKKEEAKDAFFAVLLEKLDHEAAHEAG